MEALRLLLAACVVTASATLLNAAGALPDGFPTILWMGFWSGIIAAVWTARERKPPS